jgi:hypothetical protein
MRLINIIAQYTRGGSVESSGGGGGGTETGERLVTSNYCDLCGATSAERTALLTFTDGMVEDGLYNLFPFFAPLVGNSVANKAFNMMDPLNDAAAFKLNYVGTPANHSKGLQWQSNQGATIDIDVSLFSGIPTIGGGCYSQDTNLRYAFLRTGSPFSIGFNDGGKNYVSIFAGATGVTETPTTGLLFGQREDLNTVKSYNDNVEITSETVSFSSYTGAENLTVDGQNNPVMSCYFLIAGLLDATKRTNFTNRMTTLMTDLGRAIA